MTGQRLVESREDLERLVPVADPREVVAIGLHHAQRGGVELVGALQPLAGVLAMAGELEDQAGMHVLEDGVPFRAGQLVDGIGRLPGLARARMRPGREQRRREVRDRAAHRLRQFPPCVRILLVLDRAHAEHEPRDAVGLVDLDHALGKLDRLVDLAVGQHRQEGAAEKLVVARIAAQRRAVVARGRRGVALSAGMTGGEVAAGGRGARKIRRVLCFGRRVAGTGQYERAHRGEGRVAEAGRRDHGASTPFGGRTPSAWPQGREWPVWGQPAITCPDRACQPR